MSGTVTYSHLVMILLGRVCVDARILPGMSQARSTTRFRPQTSSVRVESALPPRSGTAWMAEGGEESVPPRLLHGLLHSAETPSPSARSALWLAQLVGSVAAKAGCLIAAAVASAAVAAAVATAAGAATAVATAAGAAAAVSSAAGAAATAAAAAAGRGATAASGSASLEVLAAGLRESGVALGLLDRLAHISLPGLTGDRGTVDVTTDRTGTVVAPVPGTRWITGPHGRGQGLREAEQPGVADVEVR